VRATSADAIASATPRDGTMISSGQGASGSRDSRVSRSAMEVAISW
jgi:hypothetical protein